MRCMERVRCVFDVVNSSGHRTTRVHHTMHEHAPTPRVGAWHGTRLVLLLFRNASEPDDEPWQTFADIIKLDAGAAIS